MTALRLVASELHCGLMEVAGWTIAVVPKTWLREGEKHFDASVMVSPGQRRIVLRQGVVMDVGRENIAVGGGDDGKFVGPGEIPRAIAALRRRLATLFKEQRKRLKATKDKGDREDLKRQMLIYQAPGRKEPSGYLVPAASAASACERNINGLIQLLVWARVPPATKHLGHARNPALRLLVAALYVGELRQHIQWLRRGYVRHSEVLGRVRGRVDAVSAARSEASGLPKVRCIYQRFTESTPHFRAFRTALDHACSLDLPSFPLAHHSREAAKRGERDTAQWLAMHLRNQLADLEPLPLGKAIDVVTRLPLPAHLRGRWQDTLALARALLTSAGPAATESDLPNPELSLPAATLYELWCGYCLGKADWKVTHVQTIVAPWLLPYTKNRRADIVASRPGSEGTRRLLIDCKFKLLRNTYKAKRSGPASYRQPPVDDVNQVFAYWSLLNRTEQERASCNAALFYVPGDGTSGTGRTPILGDTATNKVTLWGDKASPPRNQSPQGFAFQGGENNDPPRLHVLRVPFPGVEHLASLADFSGFAEDVGSQLLSQLSPAAMTAGSTTDREAS